MFRRLDKAMCNGVDYKKATLGTLVNEALAVCDRILECVVFLDQAEHCTCLPSQ